MYHHRVTYKPDPEKKVRYKVDFYLTLIVFAFIGVLLAWRG